MTTCCGHCRDAGDFFNEKTALKDLRRYRRRGPDKATGLLLNAIRADRVTGKTLLDIGGGIGAIQLELFKEGLHRSVNVDASAPYQNVSKREAQRHGYADRTRYLFGDAAAMASTLPDSDIVTLDKVICCYPDAGKLLDTSLQKARSLYGVIFPRNTWITRTGFRLGNLWFRIRNSDFRTYLHPFQQIHSRILAHGFRQVSREQTILWHVLLYRK